MSHIKRFAQYAAAFEAAYETDDWSDVERFFAEDAVYEIGLPILGAERVEGREAIVAWFRDVLDRFDRKFATRSLTLLEGPKETGDEVWVLGVAQYTAEGVPDFDLKLEETVRFAGDEIVHLEDRYEPEMLEEIERFARDHAGSLGIELGM